MVRLKRLEFNFSVDSATTGNAFRVLLVGSKSRGATPPTMGDIFINTTNAQ